MSAFDVELMTVSLCHSPSKILQCRRRWEGVSLTFQWSQSGAISKSVLLLWRFSMQCPEFSLIIFEAPFWRYAWDVMHASLVLLWILLVLCSYIYYLMCCSILPFAESHFFVFSLYFWWWDYVGWLKGLCFSCCYLCQFVSCFIFNYSLYGLGSILIWLIWCYGWYLWCFVLFLWWWCHGSFYDFAL